MRLYQVVGRKAPRVDGSEEEKNPPAYRMKLFAPNEVMAKSRFWYFMHQMRKMKKTTGEILDVNEVCVHAASNDRILQLLTTYLFSTDHRKECPLREELRNLDQI